MFGVCSRNYFPDQYTSWSVDYVKKSPFDFKLRSAAFPPPLLTCESLGAMPVRHWRYASLSKSHCAFHSGDLSGLQAVVERTTAASAFSPGTHVTLFSPGYLSASSEWSKVVSTEGI